jgi:hypothetical protein
LKAKLGKARPSLSDFLSATLDSRFLPLRFGAPRHQISRQPAEQGEVLANLLAGHTKLLGDLPVAARSASLGGFVPASLEDGIRRLGEECIVLPGALARPAFESKCLE